MRLFQFRDVDHRSRADRPCSLYGRFRSRRRSVARPDSAAIANALFDALGVRVRDLPLSAERIAALLLAFDLLVNYKGNRTWIYGS